MKKRIVATVLASLLLLTACGETQAPVVVAPESSVQQSKSETVVEQPSSEEKTTEPVVVVQHPGQLQSHLTGEWKDEKVVNRRNIAIMIPNNSPALPQYGISLASIVYEAPVEGRITRLMGIFEDYDDIERIGPVRSSRDYYIYESMAYDSIYVNWGLAVPYVADLINSDRVDNVSQAVAGIASPSAEAFDRVSRGAGYATEFTGYLFLKGFNEAVARHKYETEYRDTFVQAFKFAEDGVRATYDKCDKATVIRPGGTSKNKGGYGDALPWFEYNEKDKLYYRFEYGGPQIDEYNDEQIAVSNVVFKICHGEVRDDHDYLAFGVHGEGEAYVFTDGRVIKGTWMRRSDYEPNLFFDEQGNEIIFNQGKTWLCNIWLEYSEFMEWE